MIVRLLVILSVSSALAACSSPTDARTSPPSTVAATTASTTPSGATTSAPAADTTTTVRRRTATDDLAPFLAEARHIDTRLRRAATLINAGIGDDVVTVDRVTVDAVRAAEPDAAGRVVPPGLTPELLRRTLKVFNDLVARRAAMGHFEHIGSYARAGAADPMLECLANGAGPASRFAIDLASLEQYADTQPAATSAHQSPGVGAELAVRLQLIKGRNECAEECGSAVFSDLASVTWTVRPTASTAGHGELEGVAFTVTPNGHAWVVRFNAC